MKKYILTGILAVSTLTISYAQTMKSSYFMEGSFYRHQLNPAFSNERSYFSLPVLGNLNAGIESNMGLSTFIYPSSNPKYDLTTFLDPQISSSEFMKKLKTNNKIGMNVNMQILSVGFKAGKGYATVDLGIRNQMAATLPKDLFGFVKNGMNIDGTTNYKLSNFGMDLTSFAELAVGFSRNIINDKIRIGAKAKVLVGAAYANLNYKDMNIDMSGDQWKIKANGQVHMAVPSLEFDTKEHNGKQQIVGVKTGGDIAPAGMGLAFDLGATYEVIEDLEVSLSVLDLGFIKWNNLAKGTAESDYTFDGFNEITFDEDNPDYDNNNIDAQIENLTDDLKEAFLIYSDEETTSMSKTLAATLNIGASYKMPFYKGLSFGFLSSTRIAGKQSVSEGRFYANVAPTSWFEASVNYAISSYGSSLGWMLNFHPRGFNLFFGTDSQIFKVSPQFIPVNRVNTNICMGINFPIGKKLR